MLNVKRTDRVTNAEIYRRVNQKPHGTAKRGRPAQTYYQHVAGLTNKDYQMSEHEIEEAAQDRGKWTKRVLDCIGTIT